jgi:hypothetical protein
MTAHDVPGICHAGVTTGVDKTIIPAIVAKQRQNASRKRFQIRGTSIQKFDRSTSCNHNHTLMSTRPDKTGDGQTFVVAPQVMLYENICARSAVERWMLSPPKKKKLCTGASCQSRHTRV